MIAVARSADGGVRALLQAHPRVQAVEEGVHLGIDFEIGTWHRTVFAGRPELELAGLTELADNNPLVCADVASVPDALSTLALIALGPLVRAGLMIERPTLLSNVGGKSEVTDAFLAREGWAEGVSAFFEEKDLDGVGAAHVVAAIRTPQDLDEIDDLYAECFARSFFVREEDQTWEASLVKDQPGAVYRLRIAPDEPHSLLTIGVMGDLSGKLGAAQLVHAMNVMAGLEESLGLA